MEITTHIPLLLLIPAHIPSTHTLLPKLQGLPSSFCVGAGHEAFPPGHSLPKRQPPRSISPLWHCVPAAANSHVTLQHGLASGLQNQG